MIKSKTLLAAAAALALGTATSPASAASAQEPIKSIVLVHGGFVDGSGWMDVYKILKRDGYNVTIVQNPTNSLADDVSVTKRAIAAEETCRPRSSTNPHLWPSSSIRIPICAWCSRTVLDSRRIPSSRRCAGLRILRGRSVYKSSHESD